MVLQSCSTYPELCVRKAGAGSIPVARLIVGACKGQIVQYRDGDRLNLPQFNLRLVSGPARSNCADLATSVQ